jgi:hypothetical protein
LQWRESMAASYVALNVEGADRALTAAQGAPSAFL